MKTRRGAMRGGKAKPKKPLDVRSPRALKDLEERIREGPVTLVLIYADWCGHCHQIMPHWDKAAASPNRSVQAVKVNEKMVSHMNAMVNQSINEAATPINVSAYPTIIMVNKEGEKVSEVEPAKDTAALTQAMSRTGPLAEEAGVDGLAPPSAPTPLSIPPGEKAFPSIVMNSPPSLGNAAGPLREEGKEGKEGPTNRRTPSNRRTEREGEGEGEGEGPVLPPSVSQQDTLPQSLYTMNPPAARLLQKGGSLYASLAQSAYTLAPPAVLFGMAAMMNKRTRKGTRKGTRKQVRKRHRRTQRRM